MKIEKVRDVKTPERGTSLSAGIDFFIPNDIAPIKLFPHCDVLIPSGIKANVPDDCMLMAAEKSGVVTSVEACIQCGRKPKPGAFESILVLGAKIVDADYQGEIHIHIINIGKYPVRLAPGMKIAQFILVPVRYDNIEVVDNAFDKKTERGNKGFGHGTGN